MSAARRAVAVTGLGVVTAVGSSVDAFFDSLVEGRSGIRPLAWASDIAAATIDFDAEAHFPRLHLASLDRFAQFALVAAGQAIRESGIAPERLRGSRVGVYFGSGIGGANALESAYRSFFDPAGRVSPMTVVLTMANAAAAHVSMQYGITGGALTYSIACASSAVAIGEAFRAIRDGYLDVAIAGGSEALIAPGIIAGWRAMRVLATPDRKDPSRSCRPFSADRTGIVLGEGAAALVLESNEHARGRGIRPVNAIAGYGIASDAANLSKPDRRGQVLAMRSALADAGVAPAAVGYINAHGTGTEVGDIVECESIREVFGDARVPVSSTKALHGHLLGASGAVELVASLKALETGILPPTSHHTAGDPRCDVDLVCNEPRRTSGLDTVMSNSFAFGGMNAVLVARRL